MVLVPSTTLNETNDQKFISKRVSKCIFFYLKVLMSVLFKKNVYIYINRVQNQYLANQGIQVT